MKCIDCDQAEADEYISVCFPCLGKRINKQHRAIPAAELTALREVERELIEMRRTAVNYFDRHGPRCDGDECSHFATWSKSARDYPMHSCDHCIDDMRENDRRVRSKGGSVFSQWVERDDSSYVRELSKASADASAALARLDEVRKGD